MAEFRFEDFRMTIGFVNDERALFASPTTIYIVVDSGHTISIASRRGYAHISEVARTTCRPRQCYESMQNDCDRDGGETCHCTRRMRRNGSDSSGRLEGQGKARDPGARSWCPAANARLIFYGGVASIRSSAAIIIVGSTQRINRCDICEVLSHSHAAHICNDPQCTSCYRHRHPIVVIIIDATASTAYRFFKYTSLARRPRHNPTVPGHHAPLHHLRLNRFSNFHIRRVQKVPPLLRSRSGTTRSPQDRLPRPQSGPYHPRTKRRHPRQHPSHSSHDQEGQSAAFR